MGEGRNLPSSGVDPKRVNERRTEKVKEGKKKRKEIVAILLPLPDAINPHIYIYIYTFLKSIFP